MGTVGEFQSTKKIQNNFFLVPCCAPNYDHVVISAGHKVSTVVHKSYYFDGKVMVCEQCEQIACDGLLRRDMFFVLYEFSLVIFLRPATRISLPIRLLRCTCRQASTLKRSLGRDTRVGRGLAPFRGAYYSILRVSIACSLPCSRSTR